MSKILRRLLLMIALFCGALPATALAAEWSIPDVDSLPMDAYGKTVRAGRDLIVHTAETIGPDAAAPAMRYSGNGLECQSCHLNAGTTKFALPLAGVWGVFPVFIGRENEVRTLEERIDGCMERSMNGHALPIGGPQMKAMLAYIKFISTGVPTGQSIAGRSTPPLPLPLVASDPRHGAQVFAATSFRRCGDRTASTTARVWRGRSPRPISFTPICHLARTTPIQSSACKMRSTWPCSSTASLGHITRGQRRTFRITR
jgi:hypothetical protein